VAAGAGHQPEGEEKAGWLVEAAAGQQLDTDGPGMLWIEQYFNNRCGIYATWL
jgi:hypothetical protein